MKFIGVLFFVGLICAASAKFAPLASLFASLSNKLIEAYGINDQFLDFLESQRENFPCGWPESGIPPLDPLFIEEYSMKIDSVTGLNAIDFNMRDVNAYGAQNFNMEFFNFAILRNQIQFDVTIPVMTLIGDHTTYASLIQGNVNVPVSGNGKFTMDMNNVRVNGTVQLSTLEGGYMNIASMLSTVAVTSVKADLSGFGLMNSLINSLISSAAPGIIADNQELLNSEVNGMLIPLANSILNEKTMTDLVNMLAENNMNPPESRCPAQ